MTVANSSLTAPRPAARCLAGLLSFLIAVAPVAAQTTSASPATPSSAAAHKAAHKASAKTAQKKPAAKAATRHHRPVQRQSSAVRRARTARIKLAFVASAELRPMAQQLATLRTPAAYTGVTEYAHHHTGEAAAAAYLALGRAYLLDKHDTEAIAALHQARQDGQELADYADYLAAQANQELGNHAAAEALLHGFVTRYPDSIFIDQVPELEATVLLSLNDTAGARKVLAAAQNTDAVDRPGYQLAEAQVIAALGQTIDAARLYKQLLIAHPLTTEAEVSRTKLTAMGAEGALSTAELRTLGDAYYNAHRYGEANEQYRALAHNAGLDAAARNGFAVAAAACDWKLKRLTSAQAEALADSADDSGARRLYLLMELARDHDDLTAQKRIVTEIESRFPQSQWFAEALFSSANMYMLRRDYPVASQYYLSLAKHFPSNSNAALAHWRGTWLTYRQGLYADAARLCDEQIHLYPSAKETVAALYWRGRLYETQDHKPALAAANYRTIVRVYQHFFYAQMARQRLAALGNVQAQPSPQLDQLQPQPVPVLNESFPVDSPHLAKARLLANAGLNDYIAREIAADPDSASWSALAEAQIYASYGENYRAMRSLKRAIPYAATASVGSIPLAYWRILFPEPYWETIKEESAKNHLDPYLVASLIRQESEFNPTVVSHANAYGLMQLLPAVGKTMAREEGMSNFQTFQLLDPVTNIRLGTRCLRQTIEKFGGVNEYALAAYNAGDSRVTDWKATGNFEGIDEFVESIPFAETRDYVQAIDRNIETYRAIDAAAAQAASANAKK